MTQHCNSVINSSILALLLEEELYFSFFFCFSPMSRINGDCGSCKCMAAALSSIVASIASYTNNSDHVSGNCKQTRLLSFMSPSPSLCLSSLPSLDSLHCHYLQFTAVFSEDTTVSPQFVHSLLLYCGPLNVSESSRAQLTECRKRSNLSSHY